MHTITHTTAPALLADGAVTPVTTFLLIHHGLRRDLGRMTDLLVAPAPLPDTDALQAHWALHRSILDTHHTAEDTVLFPALRGAHPELGVHLDALDAEHGLLDGLLDAVEDGLADLDGDRSTAAVAMTELARVVHAHLTAEEAHLVPVMLREMPGGGGPGGSFDPSVAIPWSADGVHPDVVAAVLADMPDAVRTQVPGWLDAWEVRRATTFGPRLRVGASQTAVPSDDGVAAA